MRRAAAIVRAMAAGALAMLSILALAMLHPAGQASAAEVRAAPSTAAPSAVLRIGSKRFTESYILGELLAQAAAPHAATEHRQGLGNTALVLAALKAGEIDLYPEYTGTIALEILKRKTVPAMPQLQRELAAMGLGVSIPLGFNNTYALAVRGDAPLRAVSELAGQGGLRFGLSHEFLGRADGWPGLARLYGLPQRPRAMDHGIVYEALAQRQVDVIDIYSTDAKISRHGLRVLADDKAYFPRYDAVLLYRLDVAQRFPAAWQALRHLEGRINERDMIAMNAAAEIQGQAFSAIARDWLARHAAPRASDALPGDAQVSAPASGRANAQANAQASAQASAEGAATGLLARLFADDLWRLTRQHLALVWMSVGAACLAGIPLGILAAYSRRLRQPVLALSGMLQTIPSLALFAMLIPLLGSIGTLPALVALVIYALLPIVRNTCTGMCGVSPGMRLAAQALGLRPLQRIAHVELPLALPVILAGIKTAAVMSVGTATIAAFIGAGGYGERITIGLALNDNAMLLAGALPAAVLALVTQAIFELLERWAMPRQQV